MANVYNRYGAGGGGGSGLYIWKKYETKMIYDGVETTDNFYFTTTAQNTSVTWYFSTSYTYENGVFTLTNPSSASQAYGNRSNLTKSYFTMPFSTSGNKMVQAYSHGSYINNQSSGVYVQPYDTSNTIKIWEYGNELIGYVVSDKSDAYPDGGEQGGFYYEKYSVIDIGKLGCTKCETGQWTQVSASYSVAVSHSLGEIPKFALVWEETQSYSSYAKTIIHNFFTSGNQAQSDELYAGGASHSALTNSYATSTTAYLRTYSSSSRYYGAGYTYKYILLA